MATSIAGTHRRLVRSNAERRMGTFFLSSAEADGMRPAVETDDATGRGTLVEGNELRYIEAGDGDRTVLLLHGGIIDAAHVSWGATIGPLAEDARVIAPDLLGYGYSEQPDIAYTQKRHVRTIEGFVETLDVDPGRLDVVGTSLGGGVGIALALRNPDLVRRLVAVDAFGLGTELPSGYVTFLRSRLNVLNKASFAVLRRSRGLTKSSLGGVAADPDALDEAVVDAVFELLQTDGIGRAYRSWRKHEVAPSGFRTHYHTDLDDLEIPALFCHGEHDEVFPIRWSERAAEIAPHGKFERFEDCAHWPPREATDRFNDLVRSFLSP